MLSWGPSSCWGLWYSATTNPTLIYSRKSCKFPRAALARLAQAHRQDCAGPAWSRSPDPVGPQAAFAKKESGHSQPGLRPHMFVCGQPCTHMTAPTHTCVLSLAHSHTHT